MKPNSYESYFIAKTLLAFPTMYWNNQMTFRYIYKPLQPIRLRVAHEETYCIHGRYYRYLVEDETWSARGKRKSRKRILLGRVYPPAEAQPSEPNRSSSHDSNSIEDSNAPKQLIPTIKRVEQPIRQEENKEEITSIEPPPIDPQQPIRAEPIIEVEHANTVLRKEPPKPESGESGTG